MNPKSSRRRVCRASRLLDPRLGDETLGETRDSVTLTRVLGDVRDIAAHRMQSYVHWSYQLDITPETSDDPDVAAPTDPETHVSKSGGTLTLRWLAGGAGGLFVTQLVVTGDELPAEFSFSIAAVPGMPVPGDPHVWDDPEQGSFPTLEELATLAAEIPLHIAQDAMDGYEVARRLRARENGAAMILVALTGWGGDEARRCTRQAGFDFHFAKPFKAHEIDFVTAQDRGAGLTPPPHGAYTHADPGRTSAW